MKKFNFRYNYRENLVYNSKTNVTFKLNDTFNLNTDTFFAFVNGLSSI